MIIFLSILIGLVTILFLITIHEFAHFIVAKLSGAYVYEFSIGMGPKIFQWGKKETRYTIRLLPLGGYVSIASELVDPPKGREEEVVEEKQLMENLHRGKKAFFISAGALMNLLLALILLMIGYAIYPWKQDLNLAPTFASYGPVAEAVDKYNREQNDETLKINVGDTIIRIKLSSKLEYTPIQNYYDLNAWLGDNVRNAKEPLIDLVFDEKREIEIKNVEPEKDNNYFLGVTASSKYLNSAQILGAGFVDTFKNSYSVLQALGKMVTFQWGELSGPVGIIKSTSAFLDPNLSAQQSISTFFRWASLLSANLFLLNMLPIPPLDGYKFVENAVEAVTRKKLNPKFKIIISVAGALLFLGIFIAITIKDIWF